MQKNLSDLKVGEIFEGELLLVSMKQEYTKSDPPKPYLDFTLGDRTGQINAKKWDTSDEIVHEKRVIQVRAGVTEYRGTKQLKIDSYTILSKESGDVSKFVKTADRDSITLTHEILDYMASIEDDLYRSITQHRYDKEWEGLDSAPAAKGVHHAYYGGLLYHTVRMCEIAEFICRQRPWLNRDLLISSVLLHDLEKKNEMIQELGIVSDYSTVGKLKGHIVMGSEEIARSAEALGFDPTSEKVVALQHILLAHHGKLEWGSPVVPQIPEAVAIHLIDQLDAKLQAVEDVYKDLNPGEWSEPVTALDKARLYKHKE